MMIKCRERRFCDDQPADHFVHAAVAQAKNRVHTNDCLRGESPDLRPLQRKILNNRNWPVGQVGFNASWPTFAKT